MPKAYSLDLRERVVRFVDEGHSRHAAASHFRVSVSFVVNLVKAFRCGKPLPKAPRRMPTRQAGSTEPFCWSRLPRRTTSPCRSWRPSFGRQWAESRAALAFTLAHTHRLSLQKKLCGPPSMIGPTCRAGARMDDDASRPCGLSRTGLSSDERNHHQDGAPARALPQGPKSPFEGPVRTLEDADLHRRPALRRADRSLRHGRADEPAYL